MIKVEALKEFTLGRFSEIKNLVRKDTTQSKNGWLFVGDTFECKEDLAKYLTGENKDKIVAVKVLEVIPEVSIVSQTPVEEIKKPNETKIDVAEYKSINKPNKRVKKNKR